MPKKHTSKTIKKFKQAKRKAWKDKTAPYRGKDYHRRVMLMDPYLTKDDDGTVGLYVSMGIIPSEDYGISFHLSFYGKHGNRLIQKWFYYSPEISVEDIWKEACAMVDEIASQEIIDTEYLKVRGFKWD